jgi:hypothetical protein
MPCNVHAQETCLVEAFNLRAAIEYEMKNLETAKEALTDMPPRAEEELDPVTLHNHALMYELLHSARHWNTHSRSPYRYDVPGCP